MKKLVVALWGSLLISQLLPAQSYHFSQFFSTPLLTNPANTGFMEGPYRLGSNFRIQGQPEGSAYFTGYVSADFKLMQQRLGEGNKGGAGVYFMNDQSMDGILQTNSIGLSAAYHVALDKENNQSIGLGFQGAYHQRRIDYSKLSFGDQFGPNGYDPSLPVTETFPNRSIGYFDVNVGMVYNIVLEDRSFFGGLSVYNLLRHNENMQEDEFKMPVRYLAQGGAQFFIGEYGKIYFSLAHLRQADAKETTFGAAYGHQLTESTKNEINFGLWYRYQDAIIPYVGYQRNAVAVGLSYDYTISSLKTASQVRNGYELTILCKAIDKQSLKTLIPWY